MGKQYDGTKEIRKENRKNEFFKKHRTAIDNGTLTMPQLGKLRNVCPATFKLYMDSIYLKKYGKTLNWNKPCLCYTCAINVLFDNGYASDEEVINITGAKQF